MGEEEETAATARSTAYSEEQEQEGKMSVYDDEYGVSSELEERGTIFHTHRCFDIVGCIIGILIGEYYAEAQPYFLLFTAGVFLYLALADLIPQLVDANTLNMALIQMAGIFIGLLIMYIIAITEEEEDCGLDSHSDH